MGGGGSLPYSTFIGCVCIVYVFLKIYKSEVLFYCISFKRLDLNPFTIARGWAQILLLLGEGQLRLSSVFKAFKLFGKPHSLAHRSGV